MKSKFQALGIVLSLSWAFSMCYTAIDDWTTNPVSTGIDNTAAPAKELPFPSVTTCRARPHHYSSWEVPKMIYNSLKLTDPDSPHAAEARQSFSQFVTNLIEFALASTLKAQVSNLYINDTLVSFHQKRTMLIKNSTFSFLYILKSKIKLLLNLLIHALFL